MLAAVALADKADDRVQTFSGGMKRRLNLGAALVHEPRLLLLDEPTVGVDPQSRNHIFEEVRRLNAAGVTILYTSHYMEEVQALCPRVGIMDHGRLVACGEVADLLRQLNGLIRIRVPRLTPELRDRLKELPDCFLSDPDGWRLERDAGIVVDPVIGADRPRPWRGPHPGAELPRRESDAGARGDDPQRTPGGTHQPGDGGAEPGARFPAPDGARIEGLTHSFV